MRRSAVRLRLARLSALASVMLLAVAGCGGRSNLDASAGSRDQGSEADGDSRPLRVAVVGHQDVVALADGRVLPLLIGKGVVHLCVRLPADDLRADWELSLTAPDTSDWRGPSRRLLDVDGRHATVCFDQAFAETGDEVWIELCGQLRRNAGTTARDTECVDLVQRPKAKAWEELFDAYRSAEVDVYLRSAERAEALGYPMRALSLRLGAAHYLLHGESPEAAEQDAEGLFDSAPAWLVDHESVAAHWLGMLADARGRHLLEAQRLEAAWRAFGEAERLFAMVAGTFWPMVEFRRASVLERLGAYDEARRRGAGALDFCSATGSCTESVMSALRFQAAWLVTIDEDAAEAELQQAKETIQASLQGMVHGEEPIDEAEHLINIALADQRLGNDPSERLASASKLLARVEESPRRRRLLEDWIEIIVAEQALTRGTPGEASRRCRALADATESGHLAALAFDCSGRAAHSAGDLAAAAESYERALEIWQFSSPLRIGQDISLGTGERPATVYRAVGLAIDRDDSNLAWTLLEGLDVESGFEVRRRTCRATAVGKDAKAWTALEGTMGELLSELRSLDRPSPGAVLEARRKRRQEVRLALVDLLRRMPGCEAGVGPQPSGARQRSAYRDLRAFALGDEIIVLRPDGDRTIAHRTAFSRRQLRSIVDRVEGHLKARDLDDAAWRRLLAPVAEALVPAALAVGKPRITVALHGILQGIPLAALPLLQGEGWLDDRLTPVLVPAAIDPVTPRDSGDRSRAPLIVINPTGELRIETRYEQLVQDAQILEREAATYEAVGRLVGDASWLHIDTHGYYDPAFAELSFLALTDGRLGLDGVRAWDPQLWFANLSGCETGRWPVTPDSGRYGIGGAFAAGRVGWVIASRTAISNRVAERFNQSFYRLLDGSVEDAYQGALEAVRHAGVPAVEWAALMLIAGNAASVDGDAARARAKSIGTTSKQGGK